MAAEAKIESRHGSKRWNPRGNVHGIAPLPPMRARLRGFAITRDARGEASRVSGRIRLPDRRTIDASVEVPHDVALTDDELAEAALVLLRREHPGARWTDPHAAAATAGVTGDRRLAAWLFRLPLYLLLWTALIVPVSFSIEHVFRERFIVPACVQWGAERGVRFVSYSQGGGEWYNVFNITGAYSSPGCTFAGGHPNHATLREIGGGRLSSIALLGGSAMVLVGVALTTLIVALAALIVEAAFRFRRNGPEG